MKIGHYIPAYNEQVHTGVLHQARREAVAAFANKADVMSWTQHSCDLIANRNQALYKGLTMGLDYLFMQDADVFSEAREGVIGKMIAVAEDNDATLVGAAVLCRTNPPRMNVSPWGPECAGRVFEAEKLGSGMILINLAKVREWYEDYEGPCFQRHYEDGRCVTPLVGSDVFFCYVVRDHGGRVVCDASIPTVHVNGVHRLAFNGEQVTDSAESEETDLAESRVATGA
jgi:hypothetical protein